MKKKFIIFALCFTLIFSGLNYKKSYADSGIISLPLLATVSALAVGTGISINNNDDLYDIGRVFYDYIDNHNTLTWATVQSVFSSSVSLHPSKLVSVKSEFLDIVKGFFDDTFGTTQNDILILDNYNFSDSELAFLNRFNYSFNFLIRSTVNGSYVILSTTVPVMFKVNKYSVGSSYSLDCISTGGVSGKYGLYNTYGNISSGTVYTGQYTRVFNGIQSDSDYTYSLIPSFPYQGGYSWDNVNDKIGEDKSISLPVPGNLGQLVGQGSTEFWGNTDNLVGSDNISIPIVDSPSINLDDVISFPSVDSPSVDSPSVPDEGIWSTVKDFIISLVVPSDTFWTDSWSGLYNNFTSSFPIVDMSGFNDLVTGEKKFPNIDINIMGSEGRIVNGDAVNSIVDWLRPIVAGFMMLCLMFFNYRKLYKLIRNSEPFEGIGKVENHAN